MQFIISVPDKDGNGNDTSTIIGEANFHAVCILESY